MFSRRRPQTFVRQSTSPLPDLTLLPPSQGGPADFWLLALHHSPFFLVTSGRTYNNSCIVEPVESRGKTRKRAHEWHCLYMSPTNNVFLPRSHQRTGGRQTVFHLLSPQSTAPSKSWSTTTVEAQGNQALRMRFEVDFYFLPGSLKVVRWMKFGRFIFLISI